MKFAAAILAAGASAGIAEDLERAGYEFSCGFWKGGVANRLSLTAETSGNTTIYKNAEGVEFTAWSGEEGYADSGCPELASGAEYLTAGAAIAAAAAALAF